MQFKEVIKYLSNKLTFAHLAFFFIYFLSLPGNLVLSVGGFHTE